MNSVYFLINLSLICIAIMVILNSSIVKKIIILSKNSRDLNPANELKLLNTVIHNVINRYIKVEVLGGQETYSAVKTAVIPMATSDILKHQSEIFESVYTQLSDIYIERIRHLYIKDIENYIKFEISEKYIAIMNNLKADKRLIAKNELSAKEQEHISEIIDVVSELKQHGLSLDEILLALDGDAPDSGDFLLDESVAALDVYNIVSSVIEEHNVDKKIVSNFIKEKGGLM